MNRSMGNTSTGYLYNKPIHKGSSSVTSDRCDDIMIWIELNKGFSVLLQIYKIEFRCICHTQFRSSVLSMALIYQPFKNGSDITSSTCYAFCRESFRLRDANLLDSEKRCVLCLIEDDSFELPLRCTKTYIGLFNVGTITHIY